MKFTPSQLEQYEAEGYIIVHCPFLKPFVEACMAAVEKVSLPPSERKHYKNKRLKKQIEDSGWTQLDHTLPFLNVILHSEFVELGKQLIGDDDLYLRNGSINELAPNRPAFIWHRDFPYPGVEFMHYFSGAYKENGCLRVVPGSHTKPKEELPKLLEELCPVPDESGQDQTDPEEFFPDVELPNEISLEVQPDEIIVRDERIWHASWVNVSPDSRLMSHWRYYQSSYDNHRFTFNDYLTPELIECLTPDQREVLWLDRDFEVCPRYQPNRERELGNVKWGLL